jgi:L-xylulokinase
MFLGIDLGLTVIKGVLFDGKGKEIIKSSVKPKILNPKNGWYERDPKDLWDCVRKVSKDISRKVNSKEIEAIGLSGYGDGCYLLDKNHKLLDNGILSYDTRAKEIVKHWEIKGLADQALDLVGQKPFAAVVPALLLWYKRNRKEKYIQIRHLMFCKDYVRFKLTNEIYTDLSDASSCLTKVHTQKYDNQILDLFGINEAKDALPEIKNSYDVGGFVTNNASKETGLKEGTLVAIGSHDIDACACGIGAIRDNIACVIAGTWSINLLVTPKPYISPRWMCRNFVEKGKWLQQASSPASVANLEWFSKYFCKEEQEKAEKEYKSIYNICDEKIKNVETNIESFAKPLSNYRYSDFLLS